MKAQFYVNLRNWGLAINVAWSGRFREVGLQIGPLNFFVNNDKPA